MPITRRTMLQLLSSSTFYLSATGVAVSEAVSGESTTPRFSPDSGPVTFPQGVASGDPQPNGVMLWTRAVPSGGSPPRVPLLLQLSNDNDFKQLLLQEQIHSSADSDYTVRSYIGNLAPDTYYYYRFMGSGGSVSRSGRTRTAPAPDQARKVNLAFASCQSFEQAHYGSWARMIEQDIATPEEDRIQFVLHLGDFIYERCWHKRQDGSPQARSVPPFPDGVNDRDYRYAVSLADYRHLYKTYLSDPHLQDARARWPFICTWDDHEFANDNFQSYSTYGGQQRLEAQRKLSSNQAWFEYVPTVLEEAETQPAHNFRPQTLDDSDTSVNQEALDSLCIYRKLSWGKLLDVVLTDSRSYRSPPCITPDLTASLGLPMSPVELVAIADAGSTYADSNPPATLPFGDGTVANPARDRAPGSLLGLQQRDWFLKTLKTSTARWKLWGNALPLLPMRLDMSALPFSDYHDSIFNLDAWAGFPYEVNYLMTYLQDAAIGGVVSLSGDHHMHGAGTIRHSTTEADARPVAVDFAVAGLSSSPLLEDIIAVAGEDHSDFSSLVYRETDGVVEPVWNMSMLSGVLASFTYSKTGLNTVASWLGPNEANPGLRWLDTTINGYGLASFDADELRVQLIAMSDCRADFKQAPAIKYVAKFHLPLWSATDTPDLQGPEFEGEPPFPYKARSI